jgi:hypothetical protein
MRDRQAVFRLARLMIGGRSSTGRQSDQPFGAAGEKSKSVARDQCRDSRFRGRGFSLNARLRVNAYEQRGRGLFIVSRLVRDSRIALRAPSLGSHARAVLLGRIGTVG